MPPDMAPQRSTLESIAVTASVRCRGYTCTSTLSICSSYLGCGAELDADWVERKAKARVLELLLHLVNLQQGCNRGATGAQQGGGEAFREQCEGRGKAGSDWTKQQGQGKDPPFPSLPFPPFLPVAGRTALTASPLQPKLPNTPQGSTLAFDSLMIAPSATWTWVGMWPPSVGEPVGAGGGSRRAGGSISMI